MDRATCDLCGSAFGFFRNRRKQCRICAKSICSECSIDVFWEEWKNYIRICVSCQIQIDLADDLESQSTFSDSDSKQIETFLESPEVLNDSQILYRTVSMCLLCKLQNQRSHSFYPAAVKSNAQDEIYLELTCSVHGLISTNIAGNGDFYKKSFFYGADISPSFIRDDEIADIEDLGVQNDERNQPLVLEIDVYPSNLDRLLTQSEVVSIIETFQGAEGVDHFIKLVGLRIPHREAMFYFNELCLSVESSIPSGWSILLELPCDRLADLAVLTGDRCALVKGRVYPFASYTLKDDETELEIFRSNILILSEILLSSFTAMQMILEIKVSFPFPDLSCSLRALLNTEGCLRLLLLSPYRQSRVVYEHYRKQIKSGSLSHDDENGESKAELNGGSTNVMKIFEIVNESSSGLITEFDWIPISFLAVIEPFLIHLGYGSYQFRSFPSCGSFSCLLPVPGEMDQFVSLSRIFDMEELYAKLYPLVFKQDGERRRLGFLKMRKILKMLRKSKNNFESDSVESLTFESIWDIFTGLIRGQKTFEVAESLIQSLRLVVIHNNMDFGCVDLRRRRQCSIVKYNSSSEWVAKCSGCI